MCFDFNANLWIIENMLNEFIRLLKIYLVELEKVNKIEIKH